MAVAVLGDALGNDLVLVLVEVIAEVEEELARREGLASRRRGALRGAAPALGAGEHVEHLLPGEVVDVRAAEPGGVLEILLGEGAGRLELLEEDVRHRRDDVEVLGKRQEVQEREDDEVVDPPGDVAHPGGHARAGRGEEPPGQP